MSAFTRDEMCVQFLKALRVTLKVPRTDRIDKRYYSRVYGGVECLAPDNNYYRGHCPHCAEAEYLEKKYSKPEVVA